MKISFYDKLKSWIVFFFLFYIVSIVSFVTEFYFQHIAFTMKDGILQDLAYNSYIYSLYFGPFTNIIQFIYFVILLILSIRHKDKKVIVWSIIFIFLNLIGGFFIFVRWLMAAAGV